MAAITYVDSYKQRGLRNQLVSTLIKKGIKDAHVIEAIRRVPRHFFIDNALLSHAYEDKAFPIGEGQTLSQPYTVAFQTEKLKIKPGDKVLEIGTGSGYQTAILLELKAIVYTIEYNEILYKQAKKMLPQLGYNPYFIHGDGSEGFSRKAPYDKILVTAGAPSVPESLIRQLTSGGCLVIPVGDRKHQQMMRIKKNGEVYVTERFQYFTFVPLLGHSGWKK